jgi:hypothetical protein
MLTGWRMTESVSEPNDRHKFVRDYDRSRQKRADRLFHWSLDMPPDADDVDVRVKRGLGWQELAVIGATALGVGWLFTGRDESLIPAPVPIVQPIDSEYEVRFFDAEGNLIDVPHVSQME